MGPWLSLTAGCPQTNPLHWSPKSPLGWGRPCFLEQCLALWFLTWKALGVLGLLQEKGDPFQGPQVGSCVTLGNELSEETLLLTKQETTGKGRLGGEQEGKGSQENCSAMWLAVSGFMVMGLVSGLSLANCSDSGSFLVAHMLFRQDGCLNYYQFSSVA